MEALAERLAGLVGARPVAWEARAASWQPTGPVEGGNERFSVRLDDGRRVFVKAAQAEHTAAWLRREHEVYAHLSGSFRRRRCPLQRRQLEVALVWTERELALY